MTITCSVSDRNDSKFAEVKIFSPSDSSFSFSLPSFSLGTLSKPLMLKKKDNQLNPCFREENVLCIISPLESCCCVEHRFLEFS